ncbi:uncharacterized protein LOC142318737 isoform X2 [Lycorma delicatula]|uniref:uncharacterized protein LOC142318737 isoform X2 n=1 Tax=Lycorma delicatula TaxID=130591 RepID=UPI003F5183DE
MVAFCLVSLVLIISDIFSLVHGQACPIQFNLTVVKVPGMVPSTLKFPIPLYDNNPGVAITAECYHRCGQSTDCSGFIVDYKQGSCFRVSISAGQTEQFIPHADSNYFEKVCLRVPPRCSEQVWPVELIPGYEMIGHQHTVLPNINSKWSCAQKCLDQQLEYNSLPCLSAQYHVWSKTCTLSHHNRHTMPDAFTVSAQSSVDYLENQCIKDKGKICWRDPIYNQSSLRADKQFDDVTQDQCEKYCEEERNFNCRAYTYRCPINNQGGSLCSLHNDKIGESSAYLFPVPCAVYKEVINCLDLNVECGQNAMIATLNSPGFTGQLFAGGRPNKCGISGTGSNTTQLIIPVPPSENEQNRCNVKLVKSVGIFNRTQASAVVVVQHHKVIQTINDRVVRVSCVLSDSRYPTFSNNITLNATFGVSEPSVQNVITGNGSNLLEPATARLVVLDLSNGGQVATETQLGEELQLRIDVDPPYNVSMIRAGHLVASSGTGQDSILLLDLRGCPPDPSIFPALVPAGDHSLTATFKAFRFPASPILRFSLVLTFCETTCQPTDCGNGVTSYGRKKRQADILQEMPLQLAIIVREPKIVAENRTSNLENSHFNGNDNLLCATYTSAIGVAIAFIIGQTFLLILCCCGLSRKERQSDQISLQSDFNPRHISWADQLNSNKLHPPFGRSKVATVSS